MTQCHQSKKGFELIMLGDVQNQEKFLSVGFEKGTRELAVWDIRQCSSPLEKQVIDRSSSFLLPFTDPGTGLIFLIEKVFDEFLTNLKGSTVFIYESLQMEPHIEKIGTHQLSNPALSACMLPRHIRDTDICEVSKLLVLAKDRLNSVSMIVPRKNVVFLQYVHLLERTIS